MSSTTFEYISLNDRKKLIEFLKIPDFIYDENQSIGKRCVATNKAIFDYFYSIGLKYSARTISVFCYSSDFQPLWKTDKNKLQQNPIIPEEEDESSDEQMLFHMEKQLETFLIENWDKQN